MVRMWSSHRKLSHLVDDSAADHYEGAHFSAAFPQSVGTVLVLSLQLVASYRRHRPPTLVRLRNTWLLPVFWRQPATGCVVSSPSSGFYTAKPSCWFKKWIKKIKEMKISYFRIKCLFSLYFWLICMGPMCAWAPGPVPIMTRWINWPCMWHIVSFCQYAKGMLIPVYH